MWSYLGYSTACMSQTKYYGRENCADTGSVRPNRDFINRKSHFLGIFCVKYTGNGFDTDIQGQIETVQPHEILKTKNMEEKTVLIHTPSDGTVILSTEKA
jgi:hypothetical protein